MKQKKFKKRYFLVCIIVVLLLYFLISIMMNKLKDNTYQSLQESEQQILLELDELYNVYKQNGDVIWKGYELDEVPIILIDTTSSSLTNFVAYAINVPEFENSLFAKEIKMPDTFNLKSVYRISRVNPSLWTSLMPYTFDFVDIGSLHAMLLKVDNTSLLSTFNENEFINLLQHEAFHEFYQLKNWSNVNVVIDADWNQQFTQKQLVSSIEVIVDVEQYQLFALEMDLLEKAYQASEIKKRDMFLEKWKVIRNYRYENFPQMQSEMLVETLEGSAQYIEWKASIYLYDNFSIPFRSQDGSTLFLSDILTTKMLELRSSYIPSFLSKDIYYTIGAMQCMLLDDLGIEWKQQLMNKRLVGELLFDAIEVSSNLSVEQIKLEENYESYHDVALKIVELLAN